MGNIRKYVKIMVNVSSENKQFCHKFCSFNMGNECTLFKKERTQLTYGDLIDDVATHIRLPECEESQIK